MPAIGANPYYALSMLDYSGETRSVRIPVAELTSANFDAEQAEYATLLAAIDAVTLGAVARERWGNDEVITNTRPADKNAQVETELLVRVTGNTTEAPYSFRIPTADYSAFNYASPPAGDQVIISGAGATTETTDLVAAIEATMSVNGESVTVVGIEVVE